MTTKAAKRKSEIKSEVVTLRFSPSELKQFQEVAESSLVPPKNVGITIRYCATVGAERILESIKTAPNQTRK